MEIYCHTNYQGNCGYVTNWIAVKMLFRPKEVRSIGKRLLILYAIPRGQVRLAKAVGNVVETQLLTPGVYGEKLFLKSQKSLKVIYRHG